MDFESGSKRENGDGKTPEGFYNSSIMYGSQMGFMWIKLNNDDIDTYVLKKPRSFMIVAL